MPARAASAKNGRRAAPATAEGPRTRAATDAVRKAPATGAEKPRAATAKRAAAGSTGDAPLRSTLVPEDWIAAATTLLAERGIDAVRVDVLAKQLGVTRGSFYWHFKDREDLLQRMLTAWRNQATEQVISRFERHDEPPDELIRELLLLPFRGRAALEAASVELAIRAWAGRDAMARQRLDEIDAQRMSYIAQCLSALGHPIGQARTRAFVLYGYLVAESLLRQHGTPAQQRERRAFVERAVTEGLPARP